MDKLKHIVIFLLLGIISCSKNDFNNPDIEGGMYEMKSLIKSYISPEYIYISPISLDSYNKELINGFKINRALSLYATCNKKKEINLYTDYEKYKYLSILHNDVIKRKVYYPAPRVNLLLDIKKIILYQINKDGSVTDISDKCVIALTGLEKEAKRKTEYIQPSIAFETVKYKKLTELTSNDLDWMEDKKNIYIETTENLDIFVEFTLSGNYKLRSKYINKNQSL